MMNGSLAPGDFILLIIFSVGLIQPILTCMSFSDDIGKLGAIIGEITDVLVQPELIRPKDGKKRPKDNSITLENVHFGYGKQEILHGSSLNIPAGSVTALVGPSGSGKSTIAKLIASLWDVDSGAIALGGVDIRDLPLESYNRRVAYGLPGQLSF